MNYFRVCFGIMTLAGAATGNATVLTFAGTADDAFNAYISTDPYTQGTLFANGTYWGNTYTGSLALTDGVTNYLHVDAWDVGGVPSMFIGQASLSDTSFWFDNNTQFAVSDTTLWSASIVSLGGTTTSITDIGINGAGPWGSRPGIDSSAHFIWTPGDVGTHRYFTLKINTVPEPASLSAVVLGGIALLRRRKTAR